MQLQGHNNIYLGNTKEKTETTRRKKQKKPAQ